jgi:RHS repeat-associated protein
MSVTMTDNPSDATIFYTKDGTTTPTHTGTTPGTNTFVYSGAINVAAGTEKIFKAIAYKSGYTDSVENDFDADNRGGGQAPQFGGPDTPSSQTIIFSVWDGDWALLEEYSFDGTTSSLAQSYLQGYHGLVKTLVDNIYYYQDELGSTSHIANSSGALLESYRYNLYGAPTYRNGSGTQITASAYTVRDLHGGARWIPELGLYDDRNRFMSPDLGRFLQPDPIGFKGDASNLYRYCGNDWANRTDPMGLEDETHRKNAVPDNSPWTEIEKDQLRAQVYAPTANQVERSGLNNTFNIGHGQTLSVHTVTVQRFVQTPRSGLVFRGDNHGPTSTPTTGGFRTTSTLTINEITGGSEVTGDTGKTQLVAGHTFPKGERHFDGAAVMTGSHQADFSMQGSARNPAFGNNAPPIQYQIGGTIDFSARHMSGYITQTRYPSTQIFVDGRSAYYHREQGGAFLGLQTSTTERIDNYY